MNVSDRLIYPLRECGKLSDIWNIYFIISFCCLSINVLIQKKTMDWWPIISELLTLGMLLIFIKWAS